MVRNVSLKRRKRRIRLSGAEACTRCDRTTSASSRTLQRRAWSRSFLSLRLVATSATTRTLSREISPARRASARCGVVEVFVPTCVSARAVAMATPKRSTTQDSADVAPSSRYDWDRSSSRRSSAISPSVAAFRRKSSSSRSSARFIRQHRTKNGRRPREKSSAVTSRVVAEDPPDGEPHESRSQDDEDGGLNALEGPEPAGGLVREHLAEAVDARHWLQSPLPPGSGAT